ncbi:methanol/ethanol family PQQ-dependent dehydrogenase [Rhodospirillum sp. A1_3_36]|uniref:methanol/ethanol family PQQ-dependent dehydrogenase n=1 Tax=Rhodospirillum sp. A1_3_36 TaxID=3391666 RepID=UPI0039A4E080
MRYFRSPEANSLLAFCFSVALTLTAAPAIAETTGAPLGHLLTDPTQWAIQTGDYANRRYSKLDQINRNNVGDLRVAWTFSTGVLRGHEGGPLVVGDTMYVHTPFPTTVYALDLSQNGRIKWKYAPHQDPAVAEVMCCDTVNRGVAYDQGKILLQLPEARVVALDAETGTEIWSTQNGEPTLGATSTATVLPVKDKVIVGISGGEYGVRGYLTAYDLETGKRLWRAYSMGPDADMLMDPKKTTQLGRPVGENSSLSSWEGDQWKIGGGPTWGWYSADLEENLVYYGTGNPSTWNPDQRPGDNRWAMSIIARDIDTGVARWVYQMTPHDQWDYDGVNEMILTEQTIDGVPRKLLTHFDRNGLAYVLDRTTGALLRADKYDPTVNWTTGVDMDPASPTYGRPEVVEEFSPEANGEDWTTEGICPASLGSKNQQPASYSPKTQLFYVPTNHLCMDYEPFYVKYAVGVPYVGATLSLYPAPGHGGTGNFIAWDNTTGTIRWSIPETFSVWSGSLATAGGVVFYGTLEGYIKAVDAETGKELYRFKTPSGIVGNIMTYEWNGRQYVAVLSGVGGWAGIGLAAGLTQPHDGAGAVGGYAALSQYTALGGQVTVFALPN